MMYVDSCPDCAAVFLQRRGNICFPHFRFENAWRFVTGSRRITTRGLREHV